MPVEIREEDVERIAAILAEQASNFDEGSRTFFRGLITRATLPAPFRMQLADFGGGDPRVTSLQLIRWARAKDVNPADPRYTTIGSILSLLVGDGEIGLEAANTLVAIIVAYDLYRDPRLVSALKARFQVPVAPAAGEAADGRSPEIDWRGPEDEVELQGFRRPPPPLLDVGFLMRAIERSRSVCRIERPERTGIGTGFLVGPDLVLTNYHVLAEEADEDPKAAGAVLTLRFGSVTAPEGSEVDGQVFRLHADHPVVGTSPVRELDYALLRVEPDIVATAGLGPLPRPANNVLGKGTALNILQHPLGGPMQLGASSNGVTGVYDDVHRIQYVTLTAGGSSGSPCFDDEWNLVALHHAERSRSFGTIREGILIEAIYEQIAEHL